MNGGKRLRSSATLLPQPSDGARLTYTDLLIEEAQDPPTEVFQPEINRAIRCPAVKVKPPPEADASDEIPPVYLMRQGNEVTQAYARLPRPPISLDHHGAQWGSVMFAVVYNRININVNSSINSGDDGIETNEAEKIEQMTFQAPSEHVVRFVAIKQLRKSVVEKYLRQGGHEDPYKEIARMQELGDNVHVLSCVEALQDDEFLYIITPKASSEGTLKDAIHWLKRETMSPDHARELFLQLLNILGYLERKGICHRDMSPDNFLFLTSHRIVAFDFALSHRAPINYETGQRTLVKPQGNFGTRAYMAPEVYRDRNFDTVSSDLWSVIIILYNLATNQPLYYIPHPADLCFRYFVLAQGLSSMPMNERTVEIMQSVRTSSDSNNNEARERQHDLAVRAMANLNISTEVMEIFENVLLVDPSKRWTLAQVMECDYVLGETRS